MTGELRQMARMMGMMRGEDDELTESMLARMAVRARQMGDDRTMGMIEQARGRRRP